MEIKEVNYLTESYSFPKETHEIGLALATLINKVDEELADGFQVSDLAAVFSTLKELKDAIEGYKEIPEELMTNPITSVLGVLNPVGFSLEKLLKGK